MSGPYPCKDVPDGCHCRCHAVGYGRASGKLRVNIWSPDQDAVITKLLADGTHPAQIAEALNQRFPLVPRTEHAVRLRINKLGLVARTGWYSRSDMARILGTTQRRLAAWEQDGLLPTASHYGKWRRHRIADVERFIVAQAGLLVDPRRITDPRLRNLAETSALVNRRAVARAS